MTARDDHELVAIIPGAGWRVRYVEDDGKTIASEPVVAWGLTAAGEVRPVTVQNREKDIYASTEWSINAQVYHPADDGMETDT